MKAREYHLQPTVFVDAVPELAILRRRNPEHEAAPRDAEADRERSKGVQDRDAPARRARHSPFDSLPRSDARYAYVLAHRRGNQARESLLGHLEPPPANG